jgi:cytochrome P450 family 49 subfamily A
MQRINIAVSRLEQSKSATNDEVATNNEAPSLLERVLTKTGDPKVAAIMALDLLLVGIDTVSI